MSTETANQNLISMTTALGIFNILVGAFAAWDSFRAILIYGGLSSDFLHTLLWFSTALIGGPLYFISGCLFVFSKQKAAMVFLGFFITAGVVSICYVLWGVPGARVPLQSRMAMVHVWLPAAFLLIAAAQVAFVLRQTKAQ